MAANNKKTTVTTTTTQSNGASIPRRWGRAARRPLEGIKQGVGQVTIEAFPRAARRRPRRRTGNPMRGYFNALSPHHLALPRATGPYMVCRTTTRFSSTGVVHLLGPMTAIPVAQTESPWAAVVGVTHPGGGHVNPMNGINNVIPIIDAGLNVSGFNDSRVTPAAFTVQVMNPGALQTTSGIVYQGRVNNVPALMDDPRTWAAYADSLVSFCSPRMCSAGKLALRGTQTSLVPFNMSKLAEFSERSLVVPGATTWNPGTLGLQFQGFAPMFVYNPDGIELEYVVTIEWRVRFDPSNPAHAGSEYHPPSSDSLWSRCVEAASSVGNGVEDIADVVAAVGAAAALL